MNCTSCKNPLQDNSVECEWCGNNIIADFQTVYPKSLKNKYWFVKKSYKYVKYLIYVLIIIFPMNNGDIQFYYKVLFGVGIMIYEGFNYFKRNKN